MNHTKRRPLARYGKKPAYWMTREELLNTAVPNNADPYYVDVIDYLGT